MNNIEHICIMAFLCIIYAEQINGIKSWLFVAIAAGLVIKAFCMGG